MAVLEYFEKKEDVKLDGQLPDYYDFQCCDLGQEDILRQVALRIYSDFHRPSWKTLKHNFHAVGIPKNLSRKINELADNDKRANLIKYECLEV